MTVPIPASVPVPASVSAREDLLQERTDNLCEGTRARIAAHSSSGAEDRELALMLGLVEIDPHGSLVKANPWDAEVGDSLPRSPKW